MEDRRFSSRSWECFDCRGCGKPVRRQRTPNSPWQRCLCCSFLDTVHDLRMREALRKGFEQATRPTAEPKPKRRLGDRPGASGDAGKAYQ